MTLKETRPSVLFRFAFRSGITRIGGAYTNLCQALGQPHTPAMTHTVCLCQRGFPGCSQHYAHHYDNVWMVCLPVSFHCVTVVTLSDTFSFQCMSACHAGLEKLSCHLAHQQPCLE